MQELLLKTLTGLANRSGLRPLATLQAMWPLLVGPELADVSRPGSVARTCLTIAVQNAAVAQDLQLRSEEILGLLRHSGASGGLHLTELRTTVQGEFHPRPSRVAAVPLLQPKRPLSSTARKALETVEDDSLRALLERVWRGAPDAARK